MKNFFFLDVLNNKKDKNSNINLIFIKKFDNNKIVFTTNFDNGII